jgi:hypothetical protein
MRQRDRRALGLGAALIVPLIVGARGLPAASAWQSAYVERARERIAARDRGEEATRVLPTLRAALAEQRSRLARSGAALADGGPPAAAAATLGSLVDQIANDAGIRVVSLELHAETGAHADLVPLGVRLIAVSDIAGLMALVRAVDGARVPLAIRELDVTAADPASADDRAEVLRLDLVITSLARREAAGHDAP